MTNDFTKFVVKRFSAIQSIGSVLESESVKMSRILSILPRSLHERRRKCLEATARLIDLDVDSSSLKQLVASAIILEPNIPSIIEKFNVLLTKGIGLLPAELCVDDVDVLLLCAHAVRDEGATQRLLKN